MNYKNFIPTKTFTKIFFPFAINYYNGKNINNISSSYIKIYNDSFDKIFNYKNKMSLQIIENHNIDYLIIKSKLLFNYEINEQENIFEENIKIFKSNNNFDISYKFIKNSKIITEIYDKDIRIIKNNYLINNFRINKCLEYDFIKEKETELLFDNIMNNIYQNNYDIR